MIEKEYGNQKAKDITVGLDIDGVVYDYHRALYVFMQCEGGYSGSEEDFWRDYIPSLPVAEQDYLISLPVPYEICIPSNRLMDELEELASSVLDIYYITSRDTSLSRITDKYLKRYNYPFKENIVFSNSKDVDCVRHGVQFFLDDMDKHVSSVSKVCKAFLKSAIHNKTYRDKFDTVYSIGEFTDRIKNESG